ncbi:MAG: tetratricopeptide repeat protein [bacterium]|nr:tetratricopeptide repeat protein [bacterium]
MRKGYLPYRTGPLGKDWRACWVAAGFLFVFLADSSQATPDQGLRETGVVVEEITAGSALQKAGLEPDDLLLAWERLPNPATPQGAQGEFYSSFDWQWVEVEQAPRGTVRLSGEHQGQPRVWTVEPGLWEATVRPTIPATRLGEYLRGRELVTAGDLESGAALWEKLADREEVGLLRCWLFLRLGDAWLEEQAWERAHAAYRLALEAARAPVAQVAIWGAIGRTYYRQGDFDQAEACFRSALGIYWETWGESLGFARNLSNLGVVARRRGQLDVAAEHSQRSLKIIQELAPDSLVVAGSLKNLGNLAWNRGHLGEALKQYKRALEIEQELAPDNLDLADSLNNLGAVAFDRGQLDVAAEHYQQALRIREKLAPDSLGVAASLNNLGNVARARGQLDEAAEHYQQALGIKQELAPDSLDLAFTLNNLGVVTWERGQLEEAAEYYQRALEIKQKLAPDSLNLAFTLKNLGVVAWERGQLDMAAEHHQQALEIREGLAPDSLQVAESLKNLGLIAQKRGQLDVALEHHQKALEIRQKLAPDSLVVAISLNELGVIAKGRGQLDLAESYFDRSLDALEGQIGKLGGSQWVKGRFRAQHRKLYRDDMELLLQRNRTEEAFAILERSRARSFLAMLEERELIFSGIPEELDRQRRSLAVRHDRTLRQITSLSATESQEKVETLHGELKALYRKRDELRSKIRQESPNLASLQEPQDLDLASVQKILDPGTVMLSYSVGEEQTDLFVITPGQALTVHTLAVGEAELQDEVGHLREMIDAAQSDDFLGNRRRAEVERVGQRLYEWLVEPAQDIVATGDRVVLIPDGPLHRLPFAALVREIGGDSASAGRGRQYFTEWKPLHSVLSATVYAELKESRRSAPQTGDSGPLLAAFGDPHYALNGEHTVPLGGSGGGDTGNGDGVITDARVRSARDRCKFDLRRLPASRREILGISGLYRNVRTYLGQGASEETFKSLDADVRIVHIAAHGCLDDRLPLNSGLFLTLPEGFPDDRDNGLLQAWEIFESVRLDADLVVLSACQSGLGEDQGGEGLIGLTRAFQYAGARTVAATLWQVEDQVTAELMVRFYRHLRDGKTKDVALRAAQIELIQGPIEVWDEDAQAREIDASSPYYWAAFQLLGDWR